jgi:hypothetical protein
MRTLDAIRLGKVATNVGRTAKDVEGMKVIRNRDTSNDLGLACTKGPNHLDRLQSLLGIELDKADPSLLIYSELLEERFSWRTPSCFRCGRSSLPGPKLSVMVKE